MVSPSPKRIMPIVVQNDTALLMLPIKFGHQSSVEALDATVDEAIAERNCTLIVLDFSLTRSVEAETSSVLNKLLIKWAQNYESITVYWQNGSSDIRNALQTVDFAKGGEKDPPISITSNLQGPQ